MSEGDVLPEDGQKLFVTAPAQPAEKPKRARRPRQTTVSPPSNDVVKPVELTVEQRLAATKLKARRLAQEQKVRIPLRLAVSLETHEALVAIAEAVGPEKITDVAVHCMELGIKQMAGPATHTFKTIPLRAPVASDDEARARAAIEAAVQSDAALESQIQAERDEAASKLHLPGRRRATAS